MVQAIQAVQTPEVLLTGKEIQDVLFAPMDQASKRRLSVIISKLTAVPPHRFEEIQDEFYALEGNNQPKERRLKSGEVKQGVGPTDTAKQRWSEISLVYRAVRYADKLGTDIDVLAETGWHKAVNLCRELQANNIDLWGNPKDAKEDRERKRVEKASQEAFQEAVGAVDKLIAAGAFVPENQEAKFRRVLEEQSNLLASNLRKQEDEQADKIAEKLIEANGLDMAVKVAACVMRAYETVTKQAKVA